MFRRCSKHPKCCFAHHGSVPEVIRKVRRCTEVFGGVRNPPKCCFAHHGSGRRWTEVFRRCTEAYGSLRKCLKSISAHKHECTEVVRKRTEVYGSSRECSNCISGAHGSVRKPHINVSARELYRTIRRCTEVYKN